MAAVLNAPIILDLGKTKRKNINELKQGRGKLVDEVEDALKEVSTSLGEQAEGKQLIPVVIVYKKKARRRRAGGLFPFFG